MMPTPVETVQDFMVTFMRAWPTADTNALASFFSEEAIYRNGPLKPVRGRAGIEATFAQFMQVVVRSMSTSSTCWPRARLS
jgi:limonene-1,2-epoxide hydrolase